MRCSQPTSDLTDQQTACATLSAKTFSVGFGNGNRQAAGGTHAGATHRASGYAQH